jgi:hypothetical protein
MVHKVTREQIEEFKSRQIKVKRNDGSIVYIGPFAKSLVYNGVDHTDYLLLAEPFIINGARYNVINMSTLKWISSMDTEGYRRISINNGSKKIKLSLGLAMLYTYIGPPPYPNWTCNHINVDNLSDRIQIRSDDRLDRIEWASPTVQNKQRVHHKNNAQSNSVILTHSITGEIKQFRSVLDAIQFLGPEHEGNVNRVLKSGNTVEEWYVKFDTINTMDGEEWKDLDQGKRLSSFGRISHVTVTGEYVEHLSLQTKKYLRTSYKGRNEYVHRLVISLFGTDEQRNKLANNYEVDHIDGDPRNNRLDNLQVLGKGDHGVKTHGKRVRIIDTNTGGVSEYITVKDAAKSINMSASRITEYLKGRSDNKRCRIEYID